MNNRANLGTDDQISDMEDELTEKMVLHNDTMMHKETGEDIQLYNDVMVVITNNSSRSSSRRPMAIFKSFSFHLLCYHTCQLKLSHIPST